MRFERQTFGPPEPTVVVVEIRDNRRVTIWIAAIHV
jgi:hypothetical protein